jgi:hypothetical protein
MEVTTKFGRKHVTSQIPSPWGAIKKWENIIPTGYNFKWSVVWDTNHFDLG